MSWSSRKKKEGIFCTVYFVRREFFYNLCLISMYSILNTLSEYLYFYVIRNITSDALLLVFQIIESLQCILKSLKPWTRYVTDGVQNCVCDSKCCLLMLYILVILFGFYTFVYKVPCACVYVCCISVLMWVVLL